MKTETETVVDSLIQDIETHYDDEDAALGYIRDLKKVLKDKQCRSELPREKVISTLLFLNESSRKMGMNKDERELLELEKSLGRIKNTAKTIGKEIENQNKMLDNLDDDVTLATGQIERENKKVIRVIKYTKENKLLGTIVVFTIIVIILGTFVFII